MKFYAHSYSLISKQRGFSLVELSIVLVILGLLVGGVLSGQSLIRAAELRSVSTDLTRYSTALYTFRDKYFALPGDMPNATSFWGAAHATPATCRTTASTTTATCDGNGDGWVHTIDSDTTRSEWYHAWKQLANAGLIEGNYTGVAGAAGIYNSVPGVNIPRSKIANAGYGLIYSNALAVDTGSLFAADYSRNYFLFGGDAGNNPPNTPVLSAEEMWNIDTKIDDGRPAYGKIISYASGARPNCVDTSVGSTAKYLLADTSKGCTIFYLLN